MTKDRARQKADFTDPHDDATCRHPVAWSSATCWPEGCARVRPRMWPRRRGYIHGGSADRGRCFEPLAAREVDGVAEGARSSWRGWPRACHSGSGRARPRGPDHALGACAPRIRRMAACSSREAMAVSGPLAAQRLLLREHWDYDVSIGMRHHRV